MLSVLARRIARHPIRIHPALRSMAGELSSVAVRLTAYVGALALIAIAANLLWAELPLATALEPAAKADWVVADRSHPAFAVSQVDSVAKTEAYEIRRHPEGGRKDVLGWAVSAAERPIAELELYRPGAELGQAGPPAHAIAARMDPNALREIGGEGIVDSQFGAVALFGFAQRAADTRRCLGFMKTLETANLRISGWSCQGDTLPARRAAIACTLNRLTLLTAGRDPRLAELFARAEL